MTNENSKDSVSFQYFLQLWKSVKKCNSKLEITKERNYTVLAPTSHELVDVKFMIR